MTSRREKIWKQWQIFLGGRGSKIIVNGYCSHETKRCLLPGIKAMINLHSMSKSKDITFSTKVHLVNAMVFPVVMYGCESWPIKKAEHWRIGTFELWYWRRLLGVPWTAIRSNQSLLKEISPEYSLEGLMLKLKQSTCIIKASTLATWCKELSHWKKTLVLGKIEG